MLATEHAAALVMAAENRAGLPGWAWALIVLAVLVIFALIWYLLSRGRTEPAPVETRRATPKMTASGVEDADLPDDDLTLIEGIGPRIAGVLRDAGIRNFTQLSRTTLGHISSLLEQADPRLLRLADPTTWPEQARLAAAGDAEALAHLQEKLKGGRRV
jgi:predicted flap endonuclease-1-like 5' DNA nuclease